MADRIPDGITAKDVRAGIEDFKNGVPHSFEDSISYDLIYEGECFPPKAILGLAATRLRGTPLHPRDFTGGEDSKCLRILRNLGFEVIKRGNQSRSWILQGNPDRFGVDRYLSKNDFVYWSVPAQKHQREIEIGDRVFIWRAAGKIKTISGIVATGVVTEGCKPQGKVDHPKQIDTPEDGEDSLWNSGESAASEVKVGVKILEKRLTPQAGMLKRDELVHAPVMAESQIIKIRTGSVFPLTTEQNNFLDALWIGVTKTLLDGRFTEGTVKELLSKRYERDAQARKMCLQIHGYDCKACGLNFEQTYGEIGRNFIEVHHVKPISEKGGSYEIDPKEDLVPLCPNCHRMIHRGEGAPLSVEELKAELTNRSR
jgi:hypothetical protein